ncbi:MAG: phosphatidate cytidylyltransferase [Chitinophagaceae bacterium]
MAFNIQTFRTRALTAIIFAAVMLTGLLWNQWSFLVLFSIIHFGCWWEYLKLTEKIHSTSFHRYTKLGLMVMGYGIMLWFCSPAYHISGYGIKENISLPVSAAGFGLLLTGIFQKNPINVKAFGYAILGLLYISLCWGLMIHLYGIKNNNPGLYKASHFYLIFFPLFVIVCMWINDTMAYIVGSLFGKTPLSKISPKKTWEGTIGGIILCAIVMGFVGFICDDWFVFGQSLSFWILFSLIAAITGTLGDLFESKLKRSAGVKDSGSIMPGHGGFLDRFDSLLLATPFVWLYVQFFLK